MREASKEPELDQLGRLRVIALQFAEGVVEREQVTGLIVDRQRGVFKIDPVGAPAPLQRALLACPLDQNPPHCLGGRGKEVPAAIPLLSLLHVHEPDVCIMHQCRGLESLTGLLLR